MKKTFILCVLFSLLSACSNKPTTDIDFNQETNFQIFKTYQFSNQIESSVDINPVMINRIQAAVEVALANKGLQKNTFIDMNSADLTIYVNYSHKEKENNASFSIGLGTSKIGSNSRGSVGISTNIPVNKIANIITKIIIDINDKRQAIWHGSDSYETVDDSSIEDINKAVTVTVNRLLANFPPQTTEPIKAKK